ncbi:2-heptyl-3-hydroxy-4(1H)-quinolone synthase [Chryseobacterium aquaeductus]|uniref:2-heptyl-3-hydroxy-4(1H)-quinolone synthase n=1 Tax=Chryseobacterium aquaeductus TaxID=2675056 RepID=A0A9N8MG86_9FLAO|nr:FAD-dependent monooxygenase [Chryseobacterium aquaeductus]CAA7330870.1 2-heptyl-3-hydroxy-4(1H)-quinolone synthase [Chryseobacterium potabilaquae]CAD7806667.1 2-heptyl-3-hydroxy-4(1H)-quinolone synthase [Chryseobacterium aquaeductus]
MSTVAIIGAGVSGLSMANYLEKNNIEYHLYERRTKDDLKGHGFILPKEGIEYLSQILDIEELYTKGSFLKKYIHYSHNGNIISEKELDNVFVISRSTLIEVLSKNVPADKISYNKTLNLIGFSEDKAEMRFEDGSSLQSDIVIASDGSRSRIRRAIFQDEEMKAVRENEVVNIIENEEIAAQIESNFLKFHHEDGGLTFGVLKLSPTKILWYCQFDTFKYVISENYTPDDIKQFMLDHFGNWNPLVTSIIKGSTYENAHIWRVYELEKLNPFYHNNIAFLGDAAHPLIPFTSQGVTSALKDSYILTQLLLEKKDLQETFEKYEQERKPEIETHIRNGRILLEQFLLPLDQQPKDTLPISYK